MLKLAITVYLLISQINIILGQTDSADIIIVYNTVHKIDTQSNFTINYPLVVFHGRDNDLSISGNKLSNDSIEKRLTTVVIEKKGNDFTYKSDNQAKRKKITSYESLITVCNLKSDIAIEYYNIGPTQYKIIDSFSKINWKLFPVEMKIGMFSCQKATTYYKGRNWEVWFTNEVAIFSGPWKLRGLPGLIVSAKDMNNNITFTLTDILKTPSKPTSIPFPLNKCQEITKKNYRYFLEEYASDPIGFQALQNGFIINSDAIFDKSKLPNGGKLNIPNNPIDLED
jgi:GLPGLI family protein